MIEKERVRLSYGGKRVIRNKKEIAGQNNNRGDKRVGTSYRQHRQLLRAPGVVAKFATRKK